jgi:hypothetical protein
MTALAQYPIRQAVLGFGAGALLMALVTLVGTALAQTPAPAIAGMQQMLEWCRQMMASVDLQGMMSGMCMMGR